MKESPAEAESSSGARLKQAHGNWVTGDRFWGRESELELFASRADDGANQLLIAQRRMGKTSLMREAANRLAAKYTCIFVDLQKAQDAPDAILEISLAMRPHKGAWGKVTETFEAVLKSVGETVELEAKEVGIKLRAGISAGNWRRRGDQLLDGIASLEPAPLLLVDELPILLNRILKGGDFIITPDRRQAADEFMSWIRDGAGRHQGRIRWVLSGSIGLGPILRQAGLSATVNSFSDFHLRPWDEQTVVGCIEALASQYDVTLEPDVAEHMYARLGIGIPHHVQVYFARVEEWAHRSGNDVITATDVDQIYEEDMLSIRGHAELVHYEERLRLVLGDDHLPLALALLTEAAVAKQLSPEAVTAIAREYDVQAASSPEAQHIVDTLEHDGYLAADGDNYRFASRLLRDWWSARHGTGYTSVLKMTSDSA